MSNGKRDMGQIPDGLSAFRQMTGAGPQRAAQQPAQAGGARSRVALDAITLDERTQPRVAIRGDIVEEYATAMLEGDEFPPVELVTDGTNTWLADGWHRFLAARANGEAEISANIHRGTLRDAVLLSVGANTRHGLRRTNADKQRAVRILLTDDEWQNKSAREIARQCGVSHQMVQNVRDQLVAEGTLSKIDSVQYVDRHGNVTEMNTAGLTAQDVRARLYQKSLGQVLKVTAVDVLPQTREEQEALARTLDDLQDWIDQMRHELD